MTPFLKLNLIVHIIAGIAAVILFYAFLISILKREPNFKFLKQSSLWGAVLFFASWLSGAYYYVVYYGKSVRSVIKAGSYPWAHGIFMETKEHVFLFLPFLALALVFAVWLLGNKILEDEKFKKSLAFLSLAIVILGTAVTAMGFAVSSAVR